MPTALTTPSTRIRVESTTAAVIASVAARQHGVASRAQLIARGISPATISRWVRVGHLHRIHRGVYAVGHPRITQEGRWLAAVLACGPNAVLAGVSAAALHHMRPRRGGDGLHICMTSATKRRRNGIAVHRPRVFDLRDATTRQGIPVTTPTRTLFDLAATVSERELRNAFERAEYLETLDRVRLATLLAGASGRRGLGRLRSLMDLESIPLSRTRSGLERIVLRICRTQKLPIPLINVILLGYEVDFLWRDARFIVEADGGQHIREQRDRDNRRDLVLGRAGYLIRRYSWDALQNQRAVTREIGEILRERSAL